MKILRAHIYVDQTQGNTTYIYPQLWLDNKEQIPSILYPNDRSDQVTDAGGTYQIVYPIVPDALVSQFLALPGFSIPTQMEIESYAAKHAPSVQRISDQNAVILALASYVKGIPLTPQQLNAIDASHPEPGIITTPPWLPAMESEYGILF